MATFDMDDLVSATELARNSSALVKQASEGKRFLIINKNTPTAALIGIEDLRRLDALTRNQQFNREDRAEELGTTAAATAVGDETRVLFVHPGTRPTHADFRRALADDQWRPDPGDDEVERLTTPIGVTRFGDLVWLTIPAHLPHGLIVGQTGTGTTATAHLIAKGLCLRYSPSTVTIAAFAGGTDSALWNGLRCAHPDHFTHFAEVDESLGEYLDREISSRAEKVSAGIDVPRLLIVLDGLFGRYPSDQTAELVEKVTTAGPELRMHLLATAQTPPKRRCMSHFAYSITLKLRSAADSRELIGSAAATRLSGPGSAILIDASYRQTDVTLFPPPGGVTTNARSAAAAAAAQAHLGGASLEDAYKAAGLTLPDPSAPTAIKDTLPSLAAAQVGDLAVFKDRYVMLLGDGTVYLDGKPERAEVALSKLTGFVAFRQAPKQIEVSNNAPSSTD